MEICFLGTAAAEGVPSLFCTCDACKEAWKRGGKEIRTRSGAIIDGKLKLDFGPDSFKHMLDNGLDYSKLHAVLITHTHEDHLEKCNLTSRQRGFAWAPEGTPPLTFCGNERLGAILAEHNSDMLAFRRMIPFEPADIAGYRVTALEAVHCVSSAPDAGWPVVFEGKTYTRSEEAFFYLIEKDGKSILYAHDTDEFTPADMEFLAGRKIDLISLDCTNARLQCNYVGHMGAADNLRMREKLLACGAADGHTVFVANHFSHNGIVPYEELEAMMPGFIISYDSMKLTV